MSGKGPRVVADEASEAAAEGCAREPLRTVCVGDDKVHVLSVDVPQLPLWLTPAQREIIEAVAAGLSNAEIAKQRGTSVKTVANQLAALFERFDVHGRGELLRAVWGLK